MKILKKSIIKRLREEYPVGCRVALIHMDDSHAPPVGTKGTVLWIDDTGSLIMKWDNGSCLNIVFDSGDRVRKLDSVTVVCYGKTESWDERRDAERFYLEAMSNSEGSECERYTNIYCALINGEKICKDGVDE